MIHLSPRQLNKQKRANNTVKPRIQIEGWIYDIHGAKPDQGILVSRQKEQAIANGTQE